MLETMLNVDHKDKLYGVLQGCVVEIRFCWFRLIIILVGFLFFKGPHSFFIGVPLVPINFSRGPLQFIRIPIKYIWVLMNFNRVRIHVNRLPINFIQFRF